MTNIVRVDTTIRVSKEVVREVNSFFPPYVKANLKKFFEDAALEKLQNMKVDNNGTK